VGITVVIDSRAHTGNGSLDPQFEIILFKPAFQDNDSDSPFTVLVVTIHISLVSVPFNQGVG
jgi:hypothetical protein